VAGHEWQLTDWLHLVEHTSKEPFAGGAIRVYSTSETDFAGTLMSAVPVLLAAVAAIGWGASDYLGGDASRGDVPVFMVVGIAELLGVVLVAPVLIARGTLPPLGSQLLLAVVAGLAVAVELGLIYRALGSGQAFMTAPVGALGTVLAVGVGLVGGDRFGIEVAIGLACAIAGGGVSAWSSPPEGTAGASRRAIATCVAAAAAVALMFSCLHAAARLDPFWATAIVHASTGLSALAAARIMRRRTLRSMLPPRRQLPPLALIAFAGAGGDIAYVVASHHGALSIVAAIASLYPLSTIALGMLLQRRRATPVQLIGIAIGLCGAAVLGVATG
jgi:drug/metabolite transporter (DMT)-like permease